jgi:polar amino acid transport system substrate-binding protein
LYYFYYQFFLLFAGNSYAQDNSEKEVVSIVADVWCPYNCDPKSDKPGFMIEIAKQVFEPKGIKVEYKAMPWERAIEETRKGSYTAIVGAAKNDAPDFLFPSEALGNSTNAFYVKADSSWKFEDISSLNKIALGVIEGYTYESSLDEYIESNKGNPSKIQSISGDTAIDQNFKKLLKGRIGAYLENINVAQKHISDNSLWGKFKMAGQMVTEDVEEQHLFIAFSPVNERSQDYARMLSEGVQELRKSGKLKDILNRYNVQDWAQE